MIDLAKTTRQYATVEEFCEFFHVAERTVYNWIAQGVLPSANVCGAKRIAIAVMREIDAGGQRKADTAEPDHVERLHRLHSVPRPA